MPPNWGNYWQSYSINCSLSSARRPVVLNSLTSCWVPSPVALFSTRTALSPFLWSLLEWYFLTSCLFLFMSPFQHHFSHFTSVSWLHLTICSGREKNTDSVNVVIWLVKRNIEAEQLVSSHMGWIKPVRSPCTVDTPSSSWISYQLGTDKALQWSLQIRPEMHCSL